MAAARHEAAAPCGAGAGAAAAAPPASPPGRRPTAVARRTAVVATAVATLLAGALLTPASAEPSTRPGAPAPVAASAPAGATADVSVVVRGRPGAPGVHAAVAAAGGTVTRDLPLVDGVAATLPAPALASLAADPAVRAVSADRVVRVQGAAADVAARTSDVHGATGVDRLREAGVDGRGSTVALVDTGVADLPQLRDRLVEVDDGALSAPARCANFSGEPDCGDSFGHGTFLAGLIAGEPTQQQPLGGVAPGARVLSVKVAGRDGATDVSTVLAAIQWVVSFRDRYGIDVLNLSLGTDSTQPTRDDPLNYAVQRAWSQGIVVVVSAANLGPSPGTVTKPADDPFVITVGAADDRGTPAERDDRLPDFSSRGPTHEGLAKPDLVAPGAHVTSLRAPGSLVEERYPAPDDGPYRRGSGTSMSAAVVSGAVALLHQRHDVTPDQVKHALTASARPVAVDDPLAVGAGALDAFAAVTDRPEGAASAGAPRARGLGSLAASRGRLQTATPEGALLTGATTAQLLLWDPVGYTTGGWSPFTWYTSAHSLVGWHDVDWGGDNWGGDNWGGDNWGGDNWGGSTWQGSHDDGPRYGRPGPAPAWYGAWS